MVLYRHVTSISVLRFLFFANCWCDGDGVVGVRFAFGWGIVVSIIVALIVWIVFFVMQRFFCRSVVVRGRRANGCVICIYIFSIVAADIGCSSNRRGWLHLFLAFTAHVVVVRLNLVLGQTDTEHVVPFVAHVTLYPVHFAFYCKQTKRNYNNEF